MGAPATIVFIAQNLAYCDEHNNEFAQVRSAHAEHLFQKQLCALGIEEDSHDNGVSSVC